MVEVCEVTKPGSLLLRKYDPSIREQLLATSSNIPWAAQGIKTGSKGQTNSGRKQRLVMEQEEGPSF